MILAASAFAIAFSLSGAVEPGYAVFPPDLALSSSQAAIWRPVVERASESLYRPSRATPHLHTKGKLPGSAIYDATAKARQDQGVVLDLAMAWKITGDRRFLAATARYLDAWVAIYRPSLNPIDETGFDSMILATDLVTDELPINQRLKIRKFWREMALGYLNAMDLQPRGSTSNWQSHRVKLATMGAFAAGDVILIARARNAFRRQIARNILRDGSVRDFHLRDALHYVTYDLEPLLMAAVSARAHGEDWFAWRSPDGTSLPQALQWLEPYARGEKRHMEFVRTTVKFDRKRAAAGDARFGPHIWNRGRAAQTYALASLCQSSYRPLLSHIIAETRHEPSAWTAFLISIRKSKSHL